MSNVKAATLFLFVELSCDPPKNIHIRQVGNVGNNANKLTFFSVATVNCLFPSSLPKNNATQASTTD